VDAHADDREARRVAAEKVWNRRVQARVQAMKKQLRDAAVVFGSREHLRLQHAQIGREVGVPFVHLRYDAVGHFDLHLRGEWESVQTMLLQNLLQPGDVAVDVGSHIGTHTVALARAVGPRGVVHAFEVASPLLDVLQANVALAGLSNVLTHRAGVGSVAQLQEQWRQSQRAQGLSDVADSDARFGIRIPVLDVLGPLNESDAAGAVPPQSPNAAAFESIGVWVPRGRHTEESPATANFAAFSLADLDVVLPAMDEATELVEVVDIDSFEWFLSRRSCPKLIKVDAEGMELSVLAGADTTVSVCRPALHLESNRGADVHARLLEYLHARNYTVYFEVPFKGYMPQSVYVGDGFHEAAHGPALISPNLLAMPSEVLASLPQLARTWLSYLTPVDPARPSSVDYAEGVRIPFQVAGVVMSQWAHGGGVEVTMPATGSIDVFQLLGDAFS
jgi:FkbM family methyltransferase